MRGGQPPRRLGAATLVGAWTNEDDAEVAPPVPVLVVDDHPEFRAAARAVVESTGRFVMAGEAASGEDGVAMAAELRPGLVLMDVNLPGIDGIEATRRLLAEAPATVVILCSTYRPSDLPDAAAGCGAAGYVRKEDLGARLLESVWEGGAQAAG